MPTLTEVIKKAKSLRIKPISGAHWVETHWVLPKGSWAEGAQKLVAAMPMDARPERPAHWYSLLSRTHWVGRVPPGNGPFYVPEWAVESQEMEASLRKAGFRPVSAHVAVLPPDGEYLVTAMRTAGKVAWNVDPLLYRVYVYPTEKGLAGKELRDYNTERWTI
jgi:signal recognition particle subunit SEC65